MKKAYLTPVTTETMLGFQLMQSMTVASAKTTSDMGLTGGEAKSRAEEEEEEAYLMNGGEADSYGSLW